MLAVTFFRLSLLGAFLLASGSHHIHSHETFSRELTSKHEGMTAYSGPYFARSLPPGMCSVDEPCVDGSCCNADSGFCGRDPDHCRAEVCVSNCKAKAECGVGAETAGAECPLNVCCGKWGYCGTSSNFCGAGCQSNCEQPGSHDHSNGDVRKLVIGYWEAWSLGRLSCAHRSIDDIKVDSMSHLNLAFAYIRPKTFEIVPMPDTEEEVWSQVLALKQKAPGLKIWISLGGWTFSDNGTDTQPVWGDIARSSENRLTFVLNLYKFMKTWGFDGVDIDWEYPGAPDRGGKPDDPDNFVILMEFIHSYFEATRSNFGLSFTAPTSYWYLRWFKIGELYKYVSWINLMTYDIHGSWDSPEDQIGSFVYAHTNLTEIDDALKLFWRNDVPADRINLGIGFYGRSYTLEDPNCTKPGCPFKDPGKPGPCTKAPGVLSFAEIEAYIKRYRLNTVYDRPAGVKYLAFHEDQWVSYDDKETLQKKVDFANEQGLLGLFVWAVDQDDTESSALAALLGGKLGTFAKQNGYDPTFKEDKRWESITGNQCDWTKCGNEKCPPGTISAGAQQYCGIGKDSKAQRQTLCCPINATPDPKTCHWTDVTGRAFCQAGCKNDEIIVASSHEPYIDGEHLSCFTGYAQYCCRSKEKPTDLCGWTNKCVKLGRDRKPLQNVCGDRNFVTTKRGTCKGLEGVSYCCDKGVDTSSCYWKEALPSNNCAGSTQCANGETRITLDEHGGPDAKRNVNECQYFVPSPQPSESKWPFNDIAFCCNPKAMSKDLITLPVPLEDLFPKPGPESDTEKLDIKLDRTMGGSKQAGSSNNPNDHAFGFHIMSGPEDEITSVDKRDGSHWEFFDCDNTIGEKRQTVKAVCTDTSENSNCHIIFKGRGAAETIVEMPDNCGPGKYAVAVSMEPSTSHDHLHNRLVKRGLHDAPVYDFTFDYDYSPIEKRADKSKVLLRIDYSDDPGYWSHIVSAHHNKRKRNLEVEEEFDGDHKAWLEHTWRKEKRSFHHKELHARWWSGNVREWWDRQHKVDVDYTGVRHRIVDKFTVPIYNQNLKCPQWGWVDDLYFRSWAELNIDIDTAAGVTVIGNLGDLKSFEESSVWFRTRGNIGASLHFKAKGKLSFHTGQAELFGAHNFGASFRVPGIVTIGPDFRILGSLAGDATLEMNAEYAVNFAKWDYSMRYPVPEGEQDDPDQEGGYSEPKILGSNEPLKWSIDASGQLIAHIIPKVTFGIVFDSSAVSNAALDLGVDAYSRLYANSQVGSSQDFYYCYGMDGGATLFANIEAPTLFGKSLNRYYPIKPYQFEIIPKTCSNDK